MNFLEAVLLIQGTVPFQITASQNPFLEAVIAPIQVILAELESDC